MNADEHEDLPRPQDTDPEYLAALSETSTAYNYPSPRQSFWRSTVILGICLLAGLVYFQFAEFQRLPWNVTDTEINKARLVFGLMLGGILGLVAMALYFLWLWRLSWKVRKSTDSKNLKIALARIQPKNHSANSGPGK